MLKGARKAMQQAKVVFVITRSTRKPSITFLQLVLHHPGEGEISPDPGSHGDTCAENKGAHAGGGPGGGFPPRREVCPLNYADVLAGMQYFSTLIKKFKVPGTPAVVVFDSRTGKTKTLNGIRTSLRTTS